MKSSAIKNIVFDIGNVLVGWKPAIIVERAFGKERATKKLIDAIFNSDVWLQLNKGQVSETDAKISYQTELDLSVQDTDKLFFHIKDSLELIPDSIDVMKQLSMSGLKIYALSDNVHEIVHYLKTKFDFWKLFDGDIISAEVGVVKPTIEIYELLLSSHSLDPNETLFFDDLPQNVEGAKSVGIHSYQFLNVKGAIDDLALHGIIV